jgi:hypothetical protein
MQIMAIRRFRSTSGCEMVNKKNRVHSKKFVGKVSVKSP